MSMHSSPGCLAELKRLRGTACEEGKTIFQVISRGKGKKAVSQSLTSNPFRMPRAEFTNCKERRPGGRKGSLDPFFMQKTLCGRPSRTITMKRKVRARRKHLERRGERPKCDWMRLCITSKSSLMSSAR